MEWTVVTGASSGLGEGFARLLAADSEALLLVARRGDQLHEVATGLRETHRGTVDILEADLAEPRDRARLFAFLEKEPIARLVNNAGVGRNGAFAVLDRQTQTRMVELNCIALMEACHAVLSGMIERRSGAILNVASTAAFQPGPWMAVYYATKAFVLSFSEALQEEAKPHGVKVAALCPGATKTEFAASADMEDSLLFRTMAGDADSVVAAGVRALGSGKAVIVPGLMNAAMAESPRLLPRSLVRKIAARFQRPNANPPGK